MVAPVDGYVYHIHVAPGDQVESRLFVWMNIVEETERFTNLMEYQAGVDENGEPAGRSTDPTPVTHALQSLLDTVPLANALALFPGAITDVLTTHPVDMDRGLVVAHKQAFEQLCQTWEHTKRT